MLSWNLDAFMKYLSSSKNGVDDVSADSVNFRGRSIRKMTWCWHVSLEEERIYIGKALYIFHVSTTFAPVIRHQIRTGNDDAKTPTVEKKH